MLKTTMFLRPQSLDCDDLRLEGNATRPVFLMDLFRAKPHEELPAARCLVGLGLGLGERETAKRRGNLPCVVHFLQRRIQQVYGRRGEELRDEGVDGIGVDVQRLADLHKVAVAHDADPIAHGYGPRPDRG